MRYLAWLNSRKLTETIVLEPCQIQTLAVLLNLRPFAILRQVVHRHAFRRLLEQSECCQSHARLDPQVSQFQVSNFTNPNTLTHASACTGVTEDVNISRAVCLDQVSCALESLGCGALSDIELQLPRTGSRWGLRDRVAVPSVQSINDCATAGR